MDAVQQGTRRHRRLRRLVPGLPARLFPDYSDPDNYLSPFFRDGNFVNNGYSNKEVNDLIVKQAGEKDATKREEILKQVQALETEDLSTIPLLQVPRWPSPERTSRVSYSTPRSASATHQ